MSESLLGLLAEAQELGFLGPGPVERHVAHAEAMARALPPGIDRSLDLGSGGGIPGLALAVARTELALVLLDARARRCDFLRRAVTELGLAGRVEVVEARAETAARCPKLREQMSAVVARSFSVPAVTAECATGFLQLGGTLVVSEPPGGSVLATRWPDGPLAELGFGPARPCGNDDASFVVCTKQRLDDRWPRRVGVPGKRPLWSD